MATQGQVFGAPQVSSKSPLTTNQMWLGVGGIATDSTAATVNTALGVTTNGTAVVGQLPGTTTNDSAAAGKVGELISSTITFANKISLTSGVVVNLTSISLTAGDWDVASVTYHPVGATTVITSIDSSISATTAAIDFTAGSFNEIGPPITAGWISITLPISPKQISLSGTTTIFLVVASTFTTSTMQAWGTIRARRVR